MRNRDGTTGTTLDDLKTCSREPAWGDYRKVGVRKRMLFLAGDCVRLEPYLPAKYYVDAGENCLELTLG